MRACVRVCGSVLDCTHKFQMYFPLFSSISSSLSLLFLVLLYFQRYIAHIHTNAHKPSRTLENGICFHGVHTLHTYMYVWMCAEKWNGERIEPNYFLIAFCLSSQPLWFIILRNGFAFKWIKFNFFSISSHFYTLAECERASERERKETNACE